MTRPKFRVKGKKQAPAQASVRYAAFSIAVYIIVTAAVPYQYGPYILPLLVSALILRIAEGHKIDPIPLLWTIALATLGSVGVAIGLLRNNAGALATSTIYIIEPLVLGLLFCGLSMSPGWTKSTLRILDIALLATAALGAAVFLSEGAGVTIPEALLDPAYSTADTSGTTLRTNYQGYNSLVFLAPYGILRFIRPGPNQSAWWSLLVLIASLSGIILSGRRILYIAVPVAIVATLILVRLAAPRPTGQSSILRMRLGVPVAAIVGLGAITMLLQMIGLHPVEALSRIAGQFTLGDANDKRTLQGHYLLEAWSSHPLMGSGAGATIPGYSRNADSPWAFELSYHLVLFNFGLIGLVLLFGWGLWILRGLARGISQLHTPAIAAIAAGFFGTILSIYVDPYVHKLDGMWMLFVPFAAATLAHAQASTITSESP